MNNLLERIYQEIIYYEEDTVRMENEIAGEIDAMAAPYHDDFSEEQLAAVKAVIYETAFIAETKAFWLGVRYAFRLWGMLQREE